MDALHFVAVALTPSVVFFVTGHLSSHRYVGRHLPPGAREQWRAVSMIERWRLRWTVRRGRAVRHPALADLAVEVARVEHATTQAPNANRNLVLLAGTSTAVGAWGFATGEPPLGAGMVLLTALFLWLLWCQPKLAACLERGARANGGALAATAP